MVSTSSPGKPDPNAWRSDPRLVEVDSLTRQGRIAEATSRADVLLAAGVEHPMLLNLLAWNHRQDGRLDDAITVLSRALLLDPDEPALLISLGDTYAAAGRPHAALEAFEAAIRGAPTSVFAQGGRARALLRLGRYVEAEALFERVLAVDPNYIDALAGIAALACQRSDFDRARRLAASILKRDPDNAEAIMVAAEAENAQKLYAESETRLRPLLAQSRLSQLDRATALILLGDALHGLGCHGPAFEAYRSGKATYRGAYASTFDDAVLEREPERIARLTRYFATCKVEPWRKAAPEASLAPRFPRHAFLIGFPRSGTTLLENIFAAHDDVIALDEIPTLPAACLDLFGSDEGLDQIAGFDAAGAEPHRRQHWENVRAARMLTPGKLLLEKMPLYTVYIPMIQKLFPNARLIFALRDPRDVVLSCFRRRFVINAAMYEFTTFEGAARYYDLVMTLAHTYLDRLDPKVIFIRNEDLIEDFEGWSRKLCDFVGLDWSDQLKDFAISARRRDIRTPSADQVRQGINPAGVGQWRRYEAQMAAVAPILAPWVERFGYAAT